MRRAQDGINFADLAYINDAAVIGTCATTLGAGPADVLDAAATVTVVLDNAGQALESVTDAELLGEANAALIRAEVVQFRTATLAAPRTYVLSNLLRGRLGTDHHIGMHGPDERFVLLAIAAGLERVRDSLALRNVAASYTAVSLYQDKAAAAPVMFTNRCVALRPLAPGRQRRHLRRLDRHPRQHELPGRHHGGGR